MESTFADINLSAVAGAIADPARARMLCALLDGRARTATELAALADIGASTASSHFQRLREQGLVEMAVQGKHRYFRLASGEVGHALEALLVVAGAERAPFKPNTPSALREARTCYDHLAGRLGVGIADALVAAGHVVLEDGGGVVTAAGHAKLGELGIGPAPAGKRRIFCRPCLDWSERRPHLAGAVGAAIAARSFALGWIERLPDTRAVAVTKDGREGFAAAFGLTLDPPAA